MTQFDAFADLETRGWADETLARNYADRFARVSDMAIPGTVAAIPAGSRVLDLCCGHGSLTAALVAAGHEVVGADFSPAMLDNAGKAAPGASFVQADAQDLPFEDGRFDAVTCNFGIMHVPDQAKALAEIARVLKPGGTFAMSVWCRPDESAAFRIFFGSVQSHGDPDVVLPEAPDFHLFSDEEGARSMFAPAGLDFVRQEVLPCEWHLDEPGALCDIFADSAARGSFLMTGQRPEYRAAIRQAVVDGCAGFKDGPIWRVPMPALLSVAKAV